MPRKTTAAVADPRQFLLFEETAPQVPRPPGEPEPKEQLAVPSLPTGGGPGQQEASARPEELAPALPTSPVSVPATLRHPRATREIHLDGDLVAYSLRRVRRRSIGFTVGIEGLSVNAPRWVSIGNIEAALQAKAGWILRKLAEQHDRQVRLASAKVTWRDGTLIPYLGASIGITLDPTATRSGSTLDALEGPAQNETDTQNDTPVRHLRIGLPATATSDQIRDAVKNWLQRQARRIFEERCHFYAPQVGVKWTRIALSSARTRWGSASGNGSIRLNWRLVHFALPVIDYVVTHELAHLREMNHSPRFWNIVKSVIPEYETAKGALKENVLPVFE